MSLDVNLNMIHFRKASVLIFLLSFLFHFTFAQVPVVLWHGMGDTSHGLLSMNPLIKVIQKEVPGIYVKSIQIGNNEFEDMFNSFFKDVNAQIEEVCRELSSDPALKNGFNAVGLSQGGQFIRALAQRCSDLKIINLITIAAQHQGVFGLPKCPPGTSNVCQHIRELLSRGAYESHLQKHVVQAQYWHDPLQEEVYRRRSLFLADVNQELTLNSTYRRNLVRVNNLVLVMSGNDTVVIPKESAWFGYYKPGQDRDLYKLQESDLYKEDRLGLKALESRGNLKFMVVDGDHLHFKMSWFIENIIHPYLK